MYQTSPKRSTISEIAAQAGVSIPTVSRVLNGRPDVAPATRARIEQMLKESGYVHNKAARGIRKGSSGINELGRWTHGRRVFTVAWAQAYCYHCWSSLIALQFG